MCCVWCIFICFPESFNCISEEFMNIIGLVLVKANSYPYESRKNCVLSD